MPKVIVNIPLFNSKSVCVHRSSPVYKRTQPEEKLEFYKFTLEQYRTRKNTVNFDICITLQHNDCPLVAEWINSLTGVRILHAPECLYTGPFGAREAVWRFCSGYDYYFTTDMDNVPILDNWIDFLIECVESNSEIGLLGGRGASNAICPSFVPNVCFKDINGISVDAYSLPVAYVTDWSFFPATTLKGFDEHWGKGWIPSESEYYTAAGVYGELYFGYKVAQLGKKVSDLSPWCSVQLTNVVADNSPISADALRQFFQSYKSGSWGATKLGPFVNSVIFTAAPDLVNYLPM